MIELIITLAVTILVLFFISLYLFKKNQSLAMQKQMLKDELKIVRKAQEAIKEQIEKEGEEFEGNEIHIANRTYFS